MINRKLISIFELMLVVLSVISFSYFVSTDLPDVFQKESSVIQFLARPIIPTVSASDYVPAGCCKETITGATCQDVLLVDKALCKTDLIGTSCNTVSECQKGCCYDSDSGICSLNAPKESCTLFGGKWDASATCSIPQCQVGCCILGDGAAMTTTRECTKLSNEYDILKVFKPLDAKNSCDSYADLKDEGACLTSSTDYSDLKNCIFTTKENCNRANQEFKKGYLCTSKELNTSCVKTTKTSCMSGDDRVYFLDSCGNKANVYDSFKGKDQTYWEKVIAPSASCNGPAEFCGNCQYTSGSICTKYIAGQNLPKPEMGDNVCKNLDCAGGRKHGESWCISDAINSQDISNPVGTRSYVATCFEGEIKLDGCADFNQEICIENKDTALKRSDAMCVINDWRSCIYANDADSYNKVKTKCDALPQCVMFNEIPGNEKYSELPGFKQIANEEQGKAGLVGKGMNTVITHCVPRFTPGYQFWSSSVVSNPFSSAGKQESNAGYGGSQSETNSLCGLGTFTCVSHIQTTSSMISSSAVDKENPECNMQAVSQSKQQVSLMMDALNDRCRSLGSCGIQYNTQGDLGRSGFDVNRIYIDKKGKAQQGYTTEGYNISESYLTGDLKDDQKANEMGTTKTLSDLTKWKSGASMLTQFGSEFGSSGSMISNAFSGSVGAPSESGTAQATAVLGALGGLAAMGAGSKALAGTTASSLLATFALAAIAFTVGSLIGKMMSKGQPPGEAAVTTAAWAGGVTAGAVAVGIGAAVYASTLSSTIIAGSFWTSISVVSGATAPGFASFGVAVCAIPLLCIAIAIAAIVYMLTAQGTDNEYYVTEFKCEAWQPPLIGKCEECNSDVRPCSEDKCRSIGNNCHYFIENGEPGYCATLSDVWAAKIDPWKEIITSGNDYTNVSSFGFRIENKKNTAKAVNAWEPVTFGIITDKEAVCKVDINHSMTFDQMRFVMASTLDYSTGKVDGRHHKIALSPHATIGEHDELLETTIPMEEGDNEYYIRCQNYAGLVNDAPFTVQVKQAEGPDLTPPLITRFAPDNNAYLANNATGLNLFVYLNEPAECRYSFDSYNMNWGTENTSEIIPMTITQTGDEVTIGEYKPVQTFSFGNGSVPLICVTGSSMGYYGEWLCAAFIENYTTNKKLYIECKDQPGLVEAGLVKRNVVQKEYSAQICETGLAITSIEPVGNVEVNANATVSLRVRTEGCINGGDASCSFRLPYYGDVYSLMLTTGNKTHIQPFSSLGQGTKDVDVVCEDTAGNVASAHTNFTVFIDSESPVITRAYIETGNLILRTNENAECLFVLNESIGCDFGFDKASGVYSDTHGVKLNEKANDKYFIKCRDTKGNMPLDGCTLELKLSDIQQ
ncbi:MAG: hypothetical protein WCI72_00835 [archaeon]